MSLDAPTVHLIDQASAEFTRRALGEGVRLDPTTVEFILRDAIMLAVAVRDTAADALPFAMWHALYVSEAVGLSDLQETVVRLQQRRDVG